MSEAPSAVSNRDALAALREMLGGVDIYLLDQLMKGRLQPQARMLALQHAVRNLRLNEAALAVENGQVMDEKTGRPVRWVPSPMIIPVSESLKEYYGSRDFEEKVAEARRGFLFSLTPG